MSTLQDLKLIKKHLWEDVWRCFQKGLIVGDPIPEWVLLSTSDPYVKRQEKKTILLAWLILLLTGKCISSCLLLSFSDIESQYFELLAGTEWPEMMVESSRSLQQIETAEAPNIVKWAGTRFSITALWT